MNINEVNPRVVSFKVVTLSTDYYQSVFEGSLPHSHSRVTGYTLTNDEYGTYAIKCEQGDVTPTRLGQYVECLVFNAKYSRRVVPVEVGN
jgi:hypothetical protein